MGIAVQEDAAEKERQQRFQRRGQQGLPVVTASGGHQEGVVQRPETSQGYPQRHGEPDLPPTQRDERGKGKDQPEAEQLVDYKPRGGGRRRGKQQQRRADDGFYFFKRKEHARHGRAERGGQSGHAAGDEIPGGIMRSAAPEMAEAAAHGGAHLDAGAFPPHGQAAGK